MTVKEIAIPALVGQEGRERGSPAIDSELFRAAEIGPPRRKECRLATTTIGDRRGEGRGPKKPKVLLLYEPDRGHSAQEEEKRDAPRRTRIVFVVSEEGGGEEFSSTCRIAFSSLERRDRGEEKKEAQDIANIFRSESRKRGKKKGAFMP